MWYNWCIFSISISFTHFASISLFPLIFSLWKKKQSLLTVILGRLTHGEREREMSRVSYIMYDIHLSIKWTFAFTLPYILHLDTKCGLARLAFFFAIVTVTVDVIRSLYFDAYSDYCHSVRNVRAFDVSICVTKNNEWKWMLKRSIRTRWEIISTSITRRTEQQHVQSKIRAN